MLPHTPGYNVGWPFWTTALDSLSLASGEKLERVMKNRGAAEETDLMEELPEVYYHGREDLAWNLSSLEQAQPQPGFPPLGTRAGYQG